MTEMKFNINEDRVMTIIIEEYFQCVDKNKFLVLDKVITNLIKTYGKEKIISIANTNIDKVINKTMKKAVVEPRNIIKLSKRINEQIEKITMEKYEDRINKIVESTILEYLKSDEITKNIIDSIDVKVKCAIYTKDKRYNFLEQVDKSSDVEMV